MFGLTTKARLRRVERQRDDWERRANNRQRELRQMEGQRESAEAFADGCQADLADWQRRALDNAQEVDRLRDLLARVRYSVVDLTDV